MARVTGREPTVFNDTSNLSKNAVDIGTIGRSRIIDDLIKAGKIDAGQIRGKWESFFIQVVAQPFPGIASGLVIAGSDKRGTRRFAEDRGRPRRSETELSRPS